MRYDDGGGLNTLKDSKEWMTLMITLAVIPPATFGEVQWRSIVVERERCLSAELGADDGQENKGCAHHPVMSAKSR